MEERERKGPSKLPGSKVEKKKKKKKEAIIDQRNESGKTFEENVFKVSQARPTGSNQTIMHQIGFLRAKTREKKGGTMARKKMSLDRRTRGRPGRRLGGRERGKEISNP